jgi:hypothetical protein
MLHARRPEQTQNIAQSVVEDFASGLDDYTPMDFLHDVSDFSTGTVRDVASIPQGTIDLIKGLAVSTPLDVAKQAGSEIIKNWSDPVRYANEHPGFFMMDLAGMGAGAAGLGKAVSSAAKRAGVTVPEFFASDVGAIGPLGKRLETGELPTILTYKRQIGGTASSPSLGSARYESPFLEGDVIMKKSAGQRMYGQAEGEIATSELNLRSGEPLRMAGVQEHPAVPYRGEAPTHGALIEFVKGLDEPNTMGEILRSSPNPDPAVVTQDLRNITLFDVVTGNVDRGFGHNLGALEGRPVAFDQGLAMNYGNKFMRSLKPGDVFAPGSVWTGKGTLSPAELNMIESWRDVLQNPSPALVRTAGPQAIKEAIHRAESLLSRKTLYTDQATSSPNYFQQKRIGGKTPSSNTPGSIPGPPAQKPLGAVLLGPEPNTRPSSWMLPDPPRGVPTMQEQMGAAISALDKKLAPAQQILMRDVVNGMTRGATRGLESIKAGNLEELNFLKRVWARHVPGEPFPAPRTSVHGGNTAEIVARMNRAMEK